ncbi:molybdopterin-guanine dinucleotide biosynthesis protein B [Thioalkalivibrio paradoxus]|uniref:Molybdopterin-guanine dinucleotide biosynthesis protein B n=1 Tax=Thioalkalivibrio paradoxus ARh 1 TaxID=713585 RepID=W0DPC8_9GAMM|nr:molybdopterin-guanine dinucleotide biosynthesis protein B [Thioalkalivibrio paradoxus]AHE99107.1 molybdopterin-guanine dinucleotide biosynthesis protein B [Thioalkalivibrio paradoxus ARh 1]
MDPEERPIPLLGFAAWSGAGKTTLLTRLLPVLRASGLEIAMIKHAHHDFDIDHPGKDSYVLRQAGASQMLVASSRRWALMVETPPDRESDPALGELVARIDRRRADLILVEGFKREPIPKVEIHRPALGKPLLCTGDPNIIAVATDQPEAVPQGIPVLALGEVREIAAFIGARFQLPGLAKPPAP